MKRALLSAGLISTVIFGLTMTPSRADPIEHPFVATSTERVSNISFTQLAQSFLGEDDEYDEENACREQLEKADEARHVHERHFPHPKDAASALAGWLAAEETMVGIRSEQFDTWRTYTSALLAFAEGPHPHFRDNAAPGTVSDDPAKPQENEPLTTERMADIAIERGAKAQTLKQATKALFEVLTPDQQAKFTEADRKGPPAPHRMPGSK
ncbi:hypothetical protein [Phyllobacterium sp. OV277]|uniref:hypothetical protein n=1 Tax=Phyllobacterium sp. OV277 TaxID=1882772 RepID=UPI00088FD9C1|nr:hypothetical protein [Phyllobacterium sp. OV277]SDP53049.1 hypothetical protein SAMN05443582_105309 [Phyllobacterium sp. OV277]